MATERRSRATTDAKRLGILDATEEIILENGYAAVSSRRVAGRMDMHAPHIHYYFSTIDDLFVAVLRRRASQSVEHMAAALDADEPLRAWWHLASDQRGTALFVELLAAANHRPALKAEIATMARDVRALQMERLATLIGQYDLDPDSFPPVLIAAAIQGLAFAIVTDESAGYDTHPAEAAQAMLRLIDGLEARRAHP